MRTRLKSISRSLARFNSVRPCIFAAISNSLGFGIPCSASACSGMKYLYVEAAKNHEWTTCVRLDRSLTHVEYKFLVNSFDNPTHESAHWEPGENRVITHHVIRMSPKTEYFNTESWGYRIIKLKLNHNLAPPNRMMLIGSLPQLGSWQTPIVMKCANKIDILTNEPVQQWSVSIVVDPTNFSFRYFYVIRNDETGTMIWERGNGRSLKSSDLHSFRQVEEQFAASPIRVKTQLYTVCQRLQLERNGSFCPTRKKPTKVTNQGYSFSEKGPSFFYYECFGRLNKLDWNFVDRFAVSQINENIIIGPYPQNEQDVETLKNLGVQAVLNLQTRLDMYHRGVNWEEIKEKYKLHGITVKNYEIFDMDPMDFEKKANKAVQLLKHLINKHELVYTHCTSGIGRAPSVVVLYLSTVLNEDLDESIQLVKSKRPSFYINYEMLKRANKKTMMFNHGEGYDFGTQQLI